MKGAMMPEQLPKVSWMPDATVLLPKRGLLLASQASGMPTQT
jgi:hypothetical protein